MIKQLIQKDCNTGKEQNIFPITTLDAIKDQQSNMSLQQLLEMVNHLFLPFVGNTKKATRLQVPLSFRKKGLWITYVSRQNTVITEYYNSTDYSDAAWSSEDNWMNYLDTDSISVAIHNLLNWYKA